ncbi:DUF6443 domain-containing protein [Pedobacter sp. SG908]|uniref:DUF6443 domain-containing protein n=1 Tax=Pedobacter sp. SG908 TaxID=2587135 RepID=UPI0014229590|nr:DUF6443 domain-containing protein [Pedobacter sp. SG908]NII83107.1 RHS repeat-associated protein [Pedobacter sp. SG908]
MKYIYITLLNLAAGLIGLDAKAQVQRNFVKTTVLLKEGKKTQTDVELSPSADKFITYEYQDGFARPIQLITVGSSPSGHDMVQPIQYDNYGKKSKNYLPYTATTQTGVYHEAQFTEQAAFYQNPNDKIADSNSPYSISRYDESPAAKLLEQGNPGDDWQLASGHTIRQGFSANTAEDHVKIYSQSGIQGEFSASLLSKTKTIDENNHETLYFSDKSGRLLLKRKQLDASIIENGQAEQVPYLDTYYIYDDYDKIIYQIPPKAAAKLAANAVSWDQNFINGNLFSYTYDKLGRMVTKKTPDAAAVYICYDKFDRPVFIQDGNLRAQNKWFYNKYDVGNRIIMRGIYNYQDPLSPGDSPREKLQNYLDQMNYATSPQLSYEERVSNTIHGYTNQTFPSSGIEIRSVYYYDDYDFDNDGSADYNYIPQGLPNEETLNITGSGFGQLTGTKNVLLGTSDWLIAVSFYNKEGKRIQLRNNNHLSLDVNNLTTAVYNFNNTLAVTKVAHNAGLGRETNVVNRFVYDHIGRMLECYQNNNSAAQDQLLVKYEYNEIGQLVDKKLHDKGNGSFLQSVDFRYNIRGWLTNINNSSLMADGTSNDEADDLFGMEFIYNTEQAGLTDLPGATRNWNGNITAVKWKVQAAATSTHNGNAIRERSYLLAYDKMDRLSNAGYRAYDGASWTAEQGGYDESAVYDRAGNILALQRNALSNGSSTSTLIDDLHYTYNDGGNQLKKVEDLSSNPEGFKNSADNAVEYAFDDNGNTNRDDNKGISQMIYNEINKIEQIIFTDGRKITYQYSSDGTRISKSVYQTGSGTPFKKTDYISGFVYENNALSYFSMPEGRVRASGQNLTYEYFIKDNLGNVRVSFEPVDIGGTLYTKLVQENHYYPFGLSMKGMAIQIALPSLANKNLYNNGSELQDDFGDDPNTYSTPTREYDPVLARMNSIDPMSDKYADWSTYNYSFNNPVNLNDPSGADPYNWRDPYDYGDDYFKGWDGGFDDGSSGSSSSGYGETFDDLVNRQFGGNPWAMANYFWNQSPAGTDYHYVPSGDGYAAARISGFTASDGMMFYTVGSYFQSDGEGNSVISNGVSGEYTSIMINNNSQPISSNQSVEQSGPDWRGVGEATLGLLGGVAEIVTAVGTEWFSAGLSTPVSLALATDGIVRASTASVKLMAAIGGQTWARSMPGNLGGVIGAVADNYTGSTNGQKIGTLVNDAFTVILTGGTSGTMTALLDPAVPMAMKALTLGAQTGAYSDVLSNGGVYDRK